MEVKTRKHAIMLTEEELRALADRLVPIRPLDYDTHTFAILRNLYGRFTRILQKYEGR